MKLGRAVEVTVEDGDGCTVLQLGRAALVLRQERPALRERLFHGRAALTCREERVREQLEALREARRARRELSRVVAHGLALALAPAQDDALRQTLGRAGPRLEAAVVGRELRLRVALHRDRLTPLDPRDRLIRVDRERAVVGLDRSGEVEPRVARLPEEHAKLEIVGARRDELLERARPRLEIPGLSHEGLGCLEEGTIVRAESVAIEERGLVVLARLGLFQGHLPQRKSQMARAERPIERDGAAHRGDRRLDRAVPPCVQGFAIQSLGLRDARHGGDRSLCVPARRHTRGGHRRGPVGDAQHARRHDAADRRGAQGADPQRPRQGLRRAATERARSSGERRTGDGQRSRAGRDRVPRLDGRAVRRARARLGCGRGRGRDLELLGRARGRRHQLAATRESALERLPQKARALHAFGRIDVERVSEHALDLVRDGAAPRAGRRPQHRVDRGLKELAQGLAGQGALQRDELDEDERERVDVGPRAGRAVALVELLGRAIRRGERRGKRAGRRVIGRRRLGEDLGDAEVEDLDRARSAEVDDEEVVRLDVAVRDALLVRERERLRRRLEELHRLGQTERRRAPAGPLRDLVRQRVPVEPLEHQVRHARPARRHERADVERLQDARRALRQLEEQAPLFAEAADEIVLRLGVEMGRKLEALQRDGDAEALVHRAVDDAEAALADDVLDAHLAVDGDAGEAERVPRGCHARERA